jgi:hypothetical protein
MNKLKTAASLTALSATLFFYAGSASADHNNSWQRINAPQQATVTVNGSARAIHPGCAFAGDDYSFYFKKGKSDKLAIFFNGGGACWDSTTCLASLQSATPAYVPSDDLAPNNPLLQDGMLNLNNPDNPYKEWSIAYLPYCTGDVHFGSKDTAYPVAPGVTQTIRHHGFDNFLYAREWLKNHFRDEDDDEGPEKILVTGVSAGAYGAALNYPHIKEAFPKAKGHLLADGGSGVLTENLMQNAMRGSNSAWNFDANLAQSVPGMTATTALSASSFTPAVYSALTNHYPKDKFSQYSTVHDLIQTMFYNIMLNSNDMSQWNNLTPELFASWTGGMLTNAYTEAASPNYRFYIAPGCQHTILRTAAMYSTQTVGGATFMDWLEGLTGGKNKKAWNNLSCTDTGCQYQPLTPEQIGACAMTP